MLDEDGRLYAHARLINAAFEKYFPATGENGTLVKSIRYTALAPGKRIRPHLTLEFCRLFGGKEEEALPYACAVEAIHTGYIIYDDLPCMDNGDLRRGRATNHRVYGEATATLAGGALTSFAFYLTSTNRFFDSETNARATALLAEKSGYTGMFGGQAEDIQNEDREVNCRDLERINRLKTGALLEAACGLGCIAAHAGESAYIDASAYALNFGAAFQIIDDYLDIRIPTKLLGKSALSDVKNVKTTFITMLGEEGALDLAKQYTERAAEAISKYPGSDYLTQFAFNMLQRKR
ncbi:MAG: polyprenyl synthetase family protein [Clostridia bacterium]|nr:polyprenyl synthetase family protein [Clostridia bacterium]